MMRAVLFVLAGGLFSSSASAIPALTQGNLVSANIYQLVDADGVFAGVSLDGYVIGARKHHNQDYYGRPTTPRQILFEGSEHKPEARVLERALALK